MNKCGITCGIQTTGVSGVDTMGTKWYIIIVTWPFMIYLICMHMLQLLHIFYHER